MAFAPLDLIFPPRCVHCRAHLGHGQALCAVCRRRIVMHRSFFCGKCHARRYSERELCHKGFPFLLAAAGEYEDPIMKSLIRSLKFDFVKSAASHLGDILAAYAFRIRISGYDMVVPMPLSQRRLRERGFNQAELVARRFSKRSMVPVNDSTLRRIRYCQPQSGLREYSERRSNVAGAFQVKRPGAVNGRSVILIDDVVTSGATMLEASMALRAAGARRILALAAAKTGRR